MREPQDIEHTDLPEQESRQPYEAPKVQSVKLTDEAAESLT